MTSTGREVDENASAETVLFVVPSLRVGGAERVLIRIANGLVATGRKVTVAVIERAGDLAAQLDDRISIEYLGGRRTIHAGVAIARMVRRLRPDVVFSTLTRVNLLILLCRPLFPSGTRLVVRQPSPASVEAQTPRVGRVYEVLIRRLYPTADVVINQSHAMAADLIENFAIPASKVVTIGNPAPPVDIDQLMKQPSPFPAGVNYLAVGRLVREKGYEDLIEAFSQVAATRLDARLTILGTGPMEPDIHRDVVARGLAARVHLLGLIDDPLPYYVHADALVLASWREGFPNCLVESLACGTPVVTTDCFGAVAELVTPGANGIVVEARKPQQLARAMIHVTSIRDRVGRERIVGTVKGYSSEVILRRYVELCSRPRVV